MASIFAPVLYLAIVVGGLFIFSHFYKKRSLAASQRIPPWYPTHPERDLYVSLLNQTEPKVSDALLKAALIRRAIADVRRVVKLREDKPALQNLLQKGSVGDDLWNSLLAAEKELEAELVEVIHEANSFVPGWGQLIFQTAGEMVQNEKMRKTFEELHEVREKQVKRYVKRTLKPSKPVGEKQTTADKTDIPIIETPPLQETPDRPHTPPQSPKSHTNGLAPPSNSGDLDSVTSGSDGEQASSVTSTPSKPKRTPKSGKKGKKRK